jgi:DNA-directed RNA polymerase specialized sigma24 family protein
MNNLPLNVYDKPIKTICQRFAQAHKNYKIEYDDLYQEAYLKLIQLDLTKPKHFILKSVVNHLINYCKKWHKDPLTEAISINDLI